MAGGSADAAAALVACDALWGTGRARDELLDDLPRSSAATCRSPDRRHGAGPRPGRAARPLAVGGTFHWVFAVADGGLSTPAVYRECDRLRAAAGAGAAVADVPDPRPDPACWPRWRAGDAAALAGALANDLQPRRGRAAAGAGRHAAGRHPRRARSARLVSGSGPTCAFLAKDPDGAGQIAAELLASGTCRAARVAAGPVPGATVIGR